MAFDKEHFVGLDYGKPAEIAKRLPEGTRSVIRDDAAAEAGMPDCWFASDLCPDKAWQEYGIDNVSVYSQDDL